jgi:hypothetical protein
MNQHAEGDTTVLLRAKARPFKKNPGPLSNHVRDSMDWLEEGTEPKIRDVQEQYENLWGQKQVIVT